MGFVAALALEYSSAFFICAHRPAKSPRAMAAAAAALSGRTSVPMRSYLAYACGVEMPPAGIHTVKKQGGQGFSGSRISPTPVTRAVPPTMENGTSAPTCAPSAHSSAAERRAPYSSFSPTRTAAASALPPAMPARTGTCFSTVMAAPARRPVPWKNASAAL